MFSIYFVEGNRDYRIIVAKNSHSAQRRVPKVDSRLGILRQSRMGKIYTYFGFKKGKLVSVLQSLDSDAKKALDCNYCITEPQDLERQIDEWKREKSA